MATHSRKLNNQAKIAKLVNDDPSIEIHDIANKTGLHIETVRTHLKSMGLPTITDHVKKYNLTRSKIYNLRRDNPEITATEIARTLQVSNMVVKKHLKALGLPIVTSRTAKSGTAEKLSDDTINKILKMRTENPNMATSEIGRKLGVRNTVVGYHLKKAGLPTTTENTEKVNRRIGDVRNKIVNMRLMEPHITGAEMARRLKTDRSSVRSYLLELGLPTTTPDTLKYSNIHSVILPSLILQMRDANPNISSYEIANKLNINPTYARTLLSTVGLEKSTDKFRERAHIYKNLSDKIQKLIEEDSEINVYEIAQQLDIGERTVQTHKQKINNEIDSNLEFIIDESTKSINENVNTERKTVPGEGPGQTIFGGLGGAIDDIDMLQVNQDTDFDRQLSEWKEQQNIQDYPNKPKVKRKRKIIDNNNLGMERLFRVTPPRPELPQVKLSKSKRKNNDLINSWFKKHKPPKHP